MSNPASPAAGLEECFIGGAVNSILSKAPIKAEDVEGQMYIRGLKFREA